MSDAHEFQICDDVIYILLFTNSTVLTVTGARDAFTFTQKKMILFLFFICDLQFFLALRVKLKCFYIFNQYRQNLDN